MSYNPEENYCSYSPDTILGVLINYGCYLHDRHYRNERARRLSRKKSDLLLRDHIFRRLKSSYETFELRLRIKKLGIDWLFLATNFVLMIWLRRTFGAFIFSRIYYYAVRLFGKRAYVDGC